MYADKQFSSYKLLELPKFFKKVPDLTGIRGHTIQKVGGIMMMGSSIYGVAAIDGSLYSYSVSAMLGVIKMKHRWFYRRFYCYRHGAIRP